MTLSVPTLDDVNVKGKTVLVRADLNVPIEGKRITDLTRLKRLLPTLKELSDKSAKVVILSHFGRPDGKYVPSLSLAPLVDALSDALPGKTIKFGVDCIGKDAKAPIAEMKEGEITLLENVRFHPQEKQNDPEFSKQLAELGDIFVNDAFSCSHRAHASLVGIADHLPAYAGRLLEEEVNALSSIFSAQEHPIVAIIGGSKVSTKLALLKNLTAKMDKIIIGGAMANTFLAAKGYSVGKSLLEESMVNTAKDIIASAENSGCDIILPKDVMVAETLEPYAANHVCVIDKVPCDGMIVDIGPASLAHYHQILTECRMAVWNGPLGAFEMTPFDACTVQIARILSALTASKQLKTIAGGGDTVSAISRSGLDDGFTYLSTAGGAFLEWLEGKTLPGIAALQDKNTAAA